MQANVLQWTAEEQALLDMYEGTDAEKKDQLVMAMLEVEDPEMIEVMAQLVLKL